MEAAASGNLPPAGLEGLAALLSQQPADLRQNGKPQQAQGFGALFATLTDQLKAVDGAAEDNSQAVVTPLIEGLPVDAEVLTAKAPAAIGGESLPLPRPDTAAAAVETVSDTRLTGEKSASSIDDSRNPAQAVPTTPGLKAEQLSPQKPLFTETSELKQAGLVEGSPKPLPGNADSETATSAELASRLKASELSDRMHDVATRAPSREPVSTQASVDTPEFDLGLAKTLEPGVRHDSGGLAAAGSNPAPSPTGVSPAVSARVPDFNLPNPFHNEAQFVDSFSEKIAFLSTRGNQSATLQLNPHDLGQLQIRVTVANATTHVEVHAFQNDTGDLMESMLPKLQQALEQQGLKLDDVKLSQSPLFNDSNRSTSQFGQHSQQPDQQTSEHASGSSYPTSADTDAMVLTEQATHNLSLPGSVDFYA